MKRTIKKIAYSNSFFQFVFGIALAVRARMVTEGSTKLNVLKAFPLFEAHGWGLYHKRAALTIQSINQTIPGVARFSRSHSKNLEFEKFLNNALSSVDDREDLRLCELFMKYGSDKSTTHNYYKIYSVLIKEIGLPKRIFEIGLGTNNVDIVSTMGSSGKPGASLRAFRDFCESAEITGADFDTRILFSEDRIKTYFVDQTDPTTFKNLSKSVLSSFDLMIDDGLHAPNANLHSLFFFLENIRVGGFAVIEDIDVLTRPLWDIVGDLISHSFTSAFIQTKTSCVFVVKRDV